MTTVTAARIRPAGTRIEVLGLLLIAVAVLAMMALGLATGSPTEDLMFFVPIAAVVLLSAGLAWRFGTWARVLGIVVSLLAGAMLFWTAFGLMEPRSAGDFVPGVAVPLGVVLGIAGGIVAIRHRREPVAAATPGERRTVQTVLAVIGVALIASTVLTVIGTESVDAGVAAGATPVEMRGFAFTPATVEVDADDPRLLVHNSDGFLHDLEVPAAEAAAVTVRPGSDAVLDLAGLAPGTYTFYCTLHSDTSVADPEEAGMAGTLVVR